MVEDVEVTESGGVTTLGFRTPTLVPEVECSVCVDNGNGCSVDKNRYMYS